MMFPTLERHRQRRGSHGMYSATAWIIACTVILLVLLLGLVSLSPILLLDDNNHHISSSTTLTRHFKPFLSSWMTLHVDAQLPKPKLPSETIRVQDDLDGGFFGYPHHDAHKATSPSPPPPIHVSYDHRSVRIDHRPVLLLGGSLHPVRHTHGTWTAALDEAVHMGLNLVTLYVIWSAHQPLSSADGYDWRLPGSEAPCRPRRPHDDDRRNGQNDDASHGDQRDRPCHADWTLATAIREAGRRGLWVHLRLGPYACAEINYGGLPEWVAHNRSDMNLRRPNRPWLEAMEYYVRKVTRYISQQRLWAHQGGNILLAQMENEINGRVDPETEHILWVAPDGTFVDEDLPGSRPADLQDYTDWCGQLARRVAPRVVWTMCEGLAAPTTIETCNRGDCASWLDEHGGTGRIGVDQPPLWTEFEGGFQIWGEEAAHPVEYFWGQTGRQYASSALRWMARGGTHLNYYMFGGGYNRDRFAAAGITNMYASDVMLCSSGERHQPKYDHLQRLHKVLREYAALFVHAPDRARPEAVEIQDDEGNWVNVSDGKDLLFRYRNATTSIVLVENMRPAPVTARWNMTFDKVANGMVTTQLNPGSVVVYEGSSLIFDSSEVDLRAKAYRRSSRQIPLPPVHKTSALSVPTNCANGWISARPIEHTTLMLHDKRLTDYTWYSTEWEQKSHLVKPVMSIETQLSNGIVAFLDGRRVGSNATHARDEGPVTLTFDMSTLPAGHHRLDMLSESLGYSNFIGGGWGASTVAKTKGITGDVYFQTIEGNQSLVQGQTWCSCLGLFSCESSGSVDMATDNNHEAAVQQSIWRFPTPHLYNDERLFAFIPIGRGHVKLNGMDLGRYWDIKRAESGRYSQSYYLFPDDYLLPNENELRIDNVLGESPEHVHLVASRVLPIEPGEYPGMEDKVDFPGACL